MAMRFGATKVDITPPLPCLLGGYYHERKAEEIRDPLYARAMVVQNGDSRIAIASCDLIYITQDIIREIRRIVAQKIALPAESILVSATHTHSGPSLELDGKCGWGSVEDNLKIAEKIAEAICSAAENMFEGTMYYGQTPLPGVAFNRISRMKDGNEVKGRNPANCKVEDIAGPAGPVDESVQVLTVRDCEMNARIVAVNFACHPDIVSDLTVVSADWPGEAAAIIENSYGPDCACILLQGTAGDIDQVDYSIKNLPQRSTIKSSQIARSVAGAAMIAAERVDSMVEDEMRASFEYIEIQNYVCTPEFAAKVEASRKKTDKSYLDFILVLAFDEWKDDGKTARYPIQCFRIGDIAIVGLSGEIFTALGLDIKKYSPAKHTIIAELANERVTNYIPTPDQAKRGAYGSIPILSRTLCADAGRMMVEAAIKNLHNLWKKAKD